MEVLVAWLANISTYYGVSFNMMLAVGIGSTPREGGNKTTSYPLGDHLGLSILVLNLHQKDYFHRSLLMSRILEKPHIVSSQFAPSLNPDCVSFLDPRPHLWLGISY